MSLILSNDHPAIPILRGEGIGVAVPAAGAGAQEGQLRIAVLNLMPDKQATELDLLRVLGRSRHAVEPVWIMTSTYRPRNADPAHLGRFYKTFGKVRMERFHGMIITGAPVEHLEFEEVLYWQELKEVMDWANANVANTLFICWAAQAALYHHFGIGKFPLEEKLFGVFDHRRDPAAHPLLDGIGAVFPVPHSRYTTIRTEDVESRDGLNILAWSEKGGIHLVDAPVINGTCITGHPEYNAATLATEYRRDRARGLNTRVPEHYFPGDDPALDPRPVWQKEGTLFYSNWMDHTLAATGNRSHR